MNNQPPCYLKDERNYCIQEQRICEFQGREWGCGYYRHAQANENMRRILKEILDGIENNTHQQNRENTTNSRDSPSSCSSVYNLGNSAGVHAFIVHARGSK